MNAYDSGTPGGVGAGSHVRRSEGGDVLHQRAGAVPRLVVVRDGGGCRADEQPHRAASASWCVVAEERLWQSQGGGLPPCGADPGGGADPAVAKAPGGGLPPSSTGGSSVWPTCSEATDDYWRLNGYGTSSARRSGPRESSSIPRSRETKSVCETCSTRPTSRFRVHYFLDEL